MPLASMTGFARAEGAAEAVRWHWEIRSVNSRGLDMRVRLPAGFERLEPAVRGKVQGGLRRGACTVNLTLQREAGAAALRINEAALEAVLAASEALMRRGDVAPPRSDGLLALKGVLETDETEPDEAAREALDTALLASLDSALHDLRAARLGEGARLRPLLDAQLTEMVDLVERAEVLPARTPEAIRQRLQESLKVLMEARPGLDSERLHQEAALLAAKADIGEELDRLRAHVAAARELLDDEEAVGRRLDFLAQEFNREVNTVCSKAGDLELTRIGLELKAVVDRFREQVQNVE